ncbi:hypothetical protein FZEAL_8954 [Fusarium zealandicum]|uniref:Carboxylesterase type B domain-containing protein n=1 Tax=Fusarium zealandicum TaxID=1053134 RepID=A0A8H4UCW4_9HYPO|nr:hypothetical protein FZEAL_8954 [Fusarium zealandicum]
MKPLTTLAPLILPAITWARELTPGLDILKGSFGTGAKESEDCLFMNAFAPTSPQPPEGRPVVLFIHGGGWQQGNGQIYLSIFASYEDIFVFAFNYRTNAFGFPNSPDMPTHDTKLGLYDQQLAIAWVQASAHAFGGDPSKVTIWRVCWLHVSRHPAQRLQLCLSTAIPSRHDVLGPNVRRPPRDHGESAGDQLLEHSIRRSRLQPYKGRAAQPQGILANISA